MCRLPIRNAAGGCWGIFGILLVMAAAAGRAPLSKVLYILYEAELRNDRNEGRSSARICDISPSSCAPACAAEAVSVVNLDTLPQPNGDGDVKEDEASASRLEKIQI